MKKTIRKSLGIKVLGVVRAAVRNKIYNGRIV